MSSHCEKGVPLMSKNLHLTAASRRIWLYYQSFPHCLPNRRTRHTWLFLRRGVLRVRGSKFMIILAKLNVDDCYQTTCVLCSVLWYFHSLGYVGEHSAGYIFSQYWPPKNRQTNGLFQRCVLQTENTHTTKMTQQRKILATTPLTPWSDEHNLLWPTFTTHLILS